MPGRKIYHQAVALITECGGEGFVFEAVMGGMSTAQVCRIADVSRGMLYEWLHKDPERYERYQDARKIGAHAMVDEALEIVDSADALSIGVDRERAKTRMWLAERANKKDFGKEAGVQVTLSIGDLHLQALRQLPDPTVVDAEFEVIEPSLEPPSLVDAPEHPSLVDLL